MALRNLRKSGQRWLGTPYNGLLAAQILADTATGDYGPGILYNEAQQPEHAGHRLRAHVTNWPATGTLRVEENGSYTAIGLPDGVHVFGYDFDLDGVYQGAAGFTITVGAQAAAAPGATLTGSATLTTGAATGQQNAAAPGATLTGSASLAPGAATGASAGSAPGATLTGNATLTPGAASGQSNAAAPGATLSGSATLNPGSATGGVSGDASAPGADLAGSANLTPGAANAANSSASATGAVLTGGASILAGSASNGIFVIPAARRRSRYAAQTMRRPNNVQR